MLAHLGRVTTLNITFDSATAATKPSHCAGGSHSNRDHSTSSRLHRPTRPKTKWKSGSIVGPLPSPSPPLKLAFRIGSETPGELISKVAPPVFGRPQATGPRSANKSCPASKPRYTGIFHIPVERQSGVLNCLIAQKHYYSYIKGLSYLNNNSFRNS